MAESVLTPSDFAQLFGVSEDTIPEECRTLISAFDFSYRTLAGDDRDRVLLQVLSRIDSGELSKAGVEGKDRWEKGWAENRDELLRGTASAEALIPKYMRDGEPVRINQNYAVTSDPKFEINWYAVFRLWLFRTYLSEASAIYEFGCGSGFNLAALAELYPDKKYYGMDWASPSVDIVNELGRKNNWRMEGHLFDFFEPDKSLKIEPNSTVLTIGALEQTGTQYEAFLQYLLDSSPALCVHIEPILEWYDPNNLIDYAAIRFHSVRRYWQGYPARLKELERGGRIEILKEKRSFFGSLNIEGFSQLIWRPIG